MKYTKFTAVQADEFNGEFKGEFKGELKSPLPLSRFSVATDLSLTATDHAPLIAVTLTAASKAVTLNLPAGSFCFVLNEGGTNAFTLKNISTDSGTSLAAGKAALVTTSTAGAGTVYVLN